MNHIKKNEPRRREEFLDINSVIRATDSCLDDQLQFKKWASTILRLHMKGMEFLAYGGVLRQQFGKDQGKLNIFEVFSEDKLRAQNFKELLKCISKLEFDTIQNMEELQQDFLTNNKNFELLLSQIGSFGETPIGFYWVIVKSGSNNIGLTLDNAAELSTSLIRTTKLYRTIDSLAQPYWINNFKTSKDISKQIAIACLKSLPCSDAVVWELDPNEKVLKTIAAVGHYRNEFWLDLPVGSGIPGICVSDSKIISIGNLSDKEELAKYNISSLYHESFINHSGWQSVLCVPIDLGGGIAGVLGVFSTNLYAFSLMDSKILLALSRELCAYYAYNDRIEKLEEIERRIEVEAPTIEAGLLAMETIHDAGNYLGIAQAYISELINNEKRKNNKTNLIALKISEFIDQSYTILKRLRIHSSIGGRPFKKINLREILNRVAANYKTDIGELRVKIIFNCPDDIVIKGNKSDLIRAFSNLLDNSLYFLEMSLKNEEKIIRIEASVSGEFVEISFWDNGVGIFPLDITKVFDYCFTTKGERGLGLGLSIAERIIKTHKGSIVCESDWGYFTKFLIKLPFS